MELCKTCSQKDFSDLVTETSELPLPRTKMWYLRDVKESIHCPFCRLIIKILSKDLIIENLQSGILIADREVLASYKFKPETLGHPENPSETAISRYWLSLHIDGKSVTRDQADTIYGHGIQLLADEGGTERNQLLKGRLVNQTQVDVGIIKKWIQLCEHEHGTACTPICSSMTEPLNRTPFVLRVIDIQRRCIVEAPPNCRYIALSYTWGSKEIAQLKLTSETQARLFIDGGLCDDYGDIPTTIKDAMYLCGMLDEQYIWVDALCIKQDDKENIISQIANMDIVYGGACLTIVAGAGHDSWAGLPGVRPESRNIPQYVELVRDVKFVSTLMPFVPAIRNSGWNQRAWTFQERVVSKRLLFLTQYQAFFNCNSALWWEDTILESRSSIDVKWSHMQDRSQQHHYKTTRDGYAQFGEYVQGYSARALTYQEDALNAFTSILKLLKRSYNIDFVEGIPQNYFDAGLFFQIILHNPSKRRHQFPSWSWVGWEANAIYENNPRTTISEVKWYRYSSNTEMTRYRDINNSEIKKADKDDGYEQLRSLWKPPGLYRTPPKAPPSSIADNASLLIFETSAALLVVDQSGKPTESSFDNELCNIRCPRATEKVIGQIRIHKEWRPTRGNSALEFIVIARYAPEQERTYRTKPGLWTMLIETDESGISRRVQTPTSTITDADWAEAVPAWRTVYLL